jgi:hypothetical protein
MKAHHKSGSYELKVAGAFDNHFDMCFTNA